MMSYPNVSPSKYLKSLTTLFIYIIVIRIRTVVTNKELSYLNNLKIKYINNYITGQLNIVKEILDDIEEMVFNE